MNTILDTKQQINTFEDLIHPHKLKEFSQQYWDKKPLLIKREDTSYFQSLFSIDKVDEVLDLNRPKGKSIRVVKNQQPLNATKYENPDGSLNLNQLYAAYADGHTVVINEIERFWKPLKRFCQSVKQELHHKTVANMYLTPKNQKALSPHYDAHDVFVVQIHGKKHWKIYDAEYPTPLTNSFQPIFQREHLKNVQDITLNAGDMLYIPRGIPHEAITTDESSLHLTIGVYPVQWMDFITKSLQQIAQGNIALRKSLPIGFLNNDTLDFSKELQTKFKELITTISESQNVKGSLLHLSEEFRTSQNPKADGHFMHLDKMDEIDLETILMHREQMNCQVQTIGTFARILFSGNVIRGPIAIAPALEFIAASTGAFKLSEIPLIIDSNKVKLTKRLIRGGLLQVQTP